jgi:hypothetical protein
MMSGSSVCSRVVSLALVALIVAGLAGPSRAFDRPNPGHPDPSTASASSYGKIPLSFEANQGQAADGVKFLSHGQGYALFLTATDAVLAFGKKSERGVLTTHLVGADPAPSVVGLEGLPGQVNYFLGNDPRSWRTDIPTYSRVAYRDVYPSTDLVYYGSAGGLEYDFVLQPGARPGAIALDLGGAQGVRIDPNGDLIVGLPGGQVVQHRPAIYQEIAGMKQAVSGGFVLLGPSRVGFAVGAYDLTRPLVIDPSLTYSTYLGGSGDDQAYGLALGGDGSVYVAGYTTSANFPTLNPFQGSLPGSCSAFVSKLNPTGSALVYSTYLGGSSCDYAYAIAVDASGSAYVTGVAGSANFPAKNALQGTNHGGGDAFVTKLDPTGGALVYSTYLGGSQEDYAQGIAVDSAGSAYVTGTTYSFDFPTFNPFQSRNKSGSGTAFVSKLSASGTSFVYSTYLGGTDYEQGQGVAVDSSANAYVTGTTGSRDFPTVNPVEGTNPSPGIGTGFVSKLNPAGSALVYSTFLGGSGVDTGYGIAVDGQRQAYVTGFTSSTDFPTFNPLQGTKRGPQNAFVTKLSASGAAFVYSTYLGGSGHDTGYGIAADSAGRAYLTGYTDSANFPIARPIQATKVAFADVFISTLKPDGSALLFSTYLGGSPYDDQGNGIAADGTGNLYVAGYTQSTRFPTKNAFQPTFGGGEYDAFVTKIGL